MRLLLDTHAFLWFITADPKLGRDAAAALRAPGSQVFLSVASAWEMAIKVGLGRLPIPQPLETFIPEQLRVNRFALLPLELAHTYAISHMPLHHRDPFDRILIAQAQTEDLVLVSADRAFDDYSVQRVW